MSKSILMVDDEDPFREIVVRKLARNGDDRVVGAADAERALEICQSQEFDVAILDISMPGMNGIELLKRLKEGQADLEAIMLTGHASVATAIEAMKLGAYDYIEKPVKFSELRLLVERAAEKRRLSQENTNLKEVLRRTSGENELIGESAALKEVLRIVDRVAPTSSPVLIEGESGTGKELVARAIHARSPRAENAFIAVNCGSLPETLLENELFGHAPGAYTGATSEQKGLFEMADGGTLLIDEVCEMDLGVQKTFLRVLESGEFRRLGEGTTRQADARIVAATNRVVRDEVEAGSFREDLYYRLNVVSIRMPPLRERKSDIPLLVDHFLSQLKGIRPEPLAIAPEALKRCQSYHWPGNVRELANLIERGVILSKDGTIRPEDLPFERLERPDRAASDGESVNLDWTLEELEKEHVRRVLDAHDGNKTQAAKTLGISLRSLYRKLDKHDLR